MWGWGGGSCGDRGAIEVVWIRRGHNCVEALSPCDQLFLKVIRVFGDSGGRRGMTGEHGLFGV